MFYLGAWGKRNTHNALKRYYLLKNHGNFVQEYIHANTQAFAKQSEYL